MRPVGRRGGQRHGPVPVGPHQSRDEGAQPPAGGHAADRARPHAACAVVRPEGGSEPGGAEHAPGIDKPTWRQRRDIPNIGGPQASVGAGYGPGQAPPAAPGTCRFRRQERGPGAAREALLQGGRRRPRAVQRLDPVPRDAAPASSSPLPEGGPGGADCFGRTRPRLPERAAGRNRMSIHSSATRLGSDPPCSSGGSGRLKHRHRRCLGGGT